MSEFDIEEEMSTTIKFVAGQYEEIRRCKYCLLSECYMTPSDHNYITLKATLKATKISDSHECVELINKLTEEYTKEFYKFKYEKTEDFELEGYSLISPHCIVMTVQTLVLRRANCFEELKRLGICKVIKRKLPAVLSELGYGAKLEKGDEEKPKEGDEPKTKEAKQM